MLILGIETSCDETAAAIVENGDTVRSAVVSSQMAKHAPYGGVVPEMAAREHLSNIDTVIQQTFAEANSMLQDIDGVAVTHTPGLIPALLVGVSYGKGAAGAKNIPLIGVNHIIAHLYAALLEYTDVMENKSAFPLLGLIISGGHTLLLLVHNDGSIKLIGQTLDDAAGEALDKAAKILSLGYPGGPIIDRLAAQGDPEAFSFPRGLRDKGGGDRRQRQERRFDFSFSGVKTALYYEVKDRPELSDDEVKDITASYQEAVVDALVEKTVSGAATYSASTIAVCGGVACNSRLREKLGQVDIPRLLITPPALCTDNAVMIAGHAYELYKQNATADLDLEASPTFHLSPDARLFCRNC